MAEERMGILYLMRILLEETDPAHPMNAAQLMERMTNRYSIGCDRKTLYANIRRLQEFGLDIGQKKGRSFGYYIKSRDFDLPELKLLVDAVQSSRFITKERSEELIKKLEKQTSQENARQLQRQVFIYNRVKADNNAIYENVDTIHAAIHENRQILFRYCEWSMEKKLVQKKNGADYRVSPWALAWTDEKYYLVAYDAAAGIIKHYRVDKMQQVRLDEKERMGKEHFDHFDLAAYSRKTFGMYGGKDVRLKLQASRELAGVVIDRFGQDVMMIPQKDGTFSFTVTVQISPQFFGWLTGIGKGIRILWPKDAAEAYQAYLRDILESLS
ncbi:MAG: WYL domain-containing protein [Blautia sp.]|nr:WYL domain-containing protein [Blautia sp.]